MIKVFIPATANDCPKVLLPDGRDIGKELEITRIEACLEVGGVTKVTIQCLADVDIEAYGADLFTKKVGQLGGLGLKQRDREEGAASEPSEDKPGQRPISERQHAMIAKAVDSMKR